MKQEDIRNILVVEAIEQTDRDFELLSQNERQEASRHAGAPLESRPSSSIENSFVATFFFTIITVYSSTAGTEQ